MMKKTDEDFISFLDVLDATLTQYEAVWSTNPVFSAQVAKFRKYYAAIKSTAEKAKIITKGATEDKDDATLAVCELARDLSQRASIYALENINMETHIQLRVSRGSLLQLADEDLSVRLWDIYNRMVGFGEVLAPYVTPEELEQFKTLIEKYDKLIPRPRGLAIERKIHNDTLPTLKKEIRKVRYKMDSLISFFNGTEFAQAYRNARRMVRSSSRKPKKTDEKKNQNT
ncbi:MAG TPA: hypothetical protein DDW85_11910 [Porphyromonadaceae bacterium]|nr:hypothetical protein [Porphyromonadaceae bacterium]